MKRRALGVGGLVAAVCGVCSVPAPARNLGQDGFVVSDGVRIHYVATGDGPLLVMLHGFPD